LVFTKYLLSLIYQNDQEMKKTVKYNGENIKVNFETANQTRVVDRMEGIRIADAHGTKGFVINAKVYKVEWTMKYKNTHSTQFHFEGFTCGDSEKKMIEHIISKHGL
jgi:carbonic anhydrase